MLSLYLDSNLLSDGVMKGAGNGGQFKPGGQGQMGLDPLANMRHLRFILLGNN